MHGKSWLKIGLQICISSLLLLWLSQQIQWIKLWHYAQGLSWWTLPLCVCLYFLAQWISAWRWHAFLNQLGMPVKQSQLFKWTMAGMVYNQFLPGTIGGDGYRVWQLANTKPHTKTNALLSVLAERGSGLAVIIWLTLLLGLFSPLTFYHFIIQMLAGFALVAYAAIRFCPVRLLPVRIASIISPIRQLIYPPKALVISLFLSILVQALMVTIHSLIAPQIPWTILGWTYGCVTLLTMIPISFNGIGLREVGYTSLLTHYCPPETALSLSFMWFVTGLLTSILGLPAIWANTARKTTPL